MTSSEFGNSPVVRALRRVFYWSALASGFCIAVMAVHTASDVSLRNISNAPLPGTLNYVTYWWMPLLVFLVLAYAHVSDQHLTVTLATENAAGFPKIISKTFTSVVSLVALGTLCYFMVDTAVDSSSRTEKIVGDVRLEIWGARILAAFGMVAYTAAVLLSFIEDVLTINDKKSAPMRNTEQVSGV